MANAPRLRLEPGRRAIALILCLPLLVAGCAVEAPEAPIIREWSLSIPVANDSTRIEDLVGDRDDYLKIDPTSGSMALHVTVPLPGSGDEVIGREEIGDNLKATSQTASFSTALGVIQLPAQDNIPPIEIRMSDLLGQDVGEGELPLIPSASFELPPQAFNIPSVTLLEIQSGGIAISVVNEMPIAMSNVRMVLRDELNGVEVDALNLGDIAANGGTANDVFDLSGSISGNLAIGVSGSTVQATNVTVQGDPALTLGISVLPLQLTRATAVIPAQTFADAQSIALDDRVLVEEAVIAKGSLTLRVTNEIPVIMSVILTLPDLRDANGQPQSLSIDQLATGVPQERTFLLDNSTFSPADPLNLRLSYEAQTFESPTEVEIAAEDAISVEAQTGELAFSKVKGVLNNITIPIPAVEREVDIPDGIDNVELASAEMQLYVTSAVGFQADVDLVIDGENSLGETRQIVITERFERGDPRNPTQISVSPDPAELTSFLNLLPNRIVITPEVRIGDGVSADSIEASHWVSIDSVVFDTAPRLALTAQSQIDDDPRDISFRDSEARERIGNNFEGARVITNLENGIPLGIGVRLYVAHSRADVYTNPSITIPKAGQEPFQVPSAPVDASGYASGTASQRQEIELSKADVLEFILEDDRSDSLFSGVQITFPATDGAVEVRSTDFVNIIAGLSIELTLDENLID